MKQCYQCKGKLKKAKTVMEKITLNCLKCSDCGEEFFSAGEMIKLDILTGRRKKVRKIGKLGSSPIIRLPKQILKKMKMKIGDYLIFEEKNEGIFIRKIDLNR